MCKSGLLGKTDCTLRKGVRGWFKIALSAMNNAFGVAGHSEDIASREFGLVASEQIAACIVVSSLIKAVAM